MFSNKNTTLTMTACVKFKAEVSKRELNAVRINKAIRACGLYVDGMKANGIRIKSIKACVDVYVRGGLGQSGSNHLKVVLSTLYRSPTLTDAEREAISCAAVAYAARSDRSVSAATLRGLLERTKGGGE